MTIAIYWIGHPETPASNIFFAETKHPNTYSWIMRDPLGERYQVGKATVRPDGTLVIIDGGDRLSADAVARRWDLRSAIPWPQS